MTVTGMEEESPPTSTLAPTTIQNNLNRSSHLRTHSHPLSLITFTHNPTPDSDSSPHSFTPLTDALNLDFVNIPNPPTERPGRLLLSPGSIPASAMQQYLGEDDPKQVSDLLVNLQLEPSSSSSSPASAAEVAKVLDNFNILLERISCREETEPEGSDPSKFVSPTSASSSSAKIKSSVEAFADLLLRGEADSSEEDEDLLIVVESRAGDEEEVGDDLEGQEDDTLTSLRGEYDEDGEGYESDRPMVRASMRKLRPIKVKLRPVVECGAETSTPAPDGGELVSILVIGEGASASGSNESEPGLPSSSSRISEGVRERSSSPGAGPSSPGNSGGIIGGATAVDMSPVTLASTLPLYSNSSLPESQSSPLPPSTGPRNESPAPPTTSSTSTPSSSPSTPLPPPPVRRRIGVAPGVGSVPTPGRWPHRLSSLLALIGCTLGLNNVCRFGLLSVNYGPNFVIQWLFLSLTFGVPLLTFHMSLGQYLHSGIVGMWKISPIFQGIGVGLLFSQALVGLYSTVGVSWMLIYFRDSFITRGDQYRWGSCVREFRECDPLNGTAAELGDTVPDYFSAVVLQRSSPDLPNSVYVPNSLKFTVAFNLAVVWMLIFVSLSKGLKSYGKVVHGFVLAPVAGIFVLTFKMVGVVENTASLFGQTAWVDFFFNTQTWVVAAREVFFTWGLLGACVMQVTSHNRHAHPLKSDAVIVVLVTTVVLLLAAFIGNSCLAIIAAATPASATTLLQHYSYVASSFESDRTYKFLAVGGSGDPAFSHHHNPLLMGVRILRTGGGGGDPTASGYQILRLATELFPTAMAVLSPGGLSPFWTVLFYFTLVLFGLAQQLAIWHTVIKGVIAIRYKMLKSWETTITFFVCALGFALGLPLCTETGVFVTYFLDFAVGSGWWIMILYLLELVAVFIVRGAPYCGENIVTVLVTGVGRLPKFFGPLISFIWNVIMPVALLVLSIASFKSGNIRELYDWNPNRGYIFWPSWTREVGSLLQLLPILAVPFVAIVQSCRYLTSGSADVFERMQQLYRPSTRLRFGSSSSEREGRSASGGRSEDPPPKYTPPPSYSTATGAKIARFLRNSIRRSMRRITTNPNGPSSSSESNLPPPPAYASVILEIQGSAQSSSTSAAASAPPPLYSEATSRNKIGSVLQPNLTRAKLPLSQALSSDLTRKERGSGRRISSEINSRDIARMLRLRGEDAQVAQAVAVAGPSSGSEGHQSLKKMGQDDLTFLEETPTFDLLRFNQSRNRNSNDSQLALISDGYLYDNHTLGHSSRASSRADVELDVDMRLIGFQRHSEA